MQHKMQLLAALCEINIAHVHSYALNSQTWNFAIWNYWCEKSIYNTTIQANFTVYRLKIWNGVYIAS